MRTLPLLFSSLLVVVILSGCVPDRKMRSAYRDFNTSQTVYRQQPIVLSDSNRAQIAYRQVLPPDPMKPMTAGQAFAKGLGEGIQQLAQMKKQQYTQEQERRAVQKIQHEQRLEKIAYGEHLRKQQQVRIADALTHVFPELDQDQRMQMAGLPAKVLEKVVNQRLENRKTSKLNSVAPGELIFTEAEKTETSKWKNKSMDDLVRDAFLGDRGALYMLGMSFLLGQGGFTINVEKANQCFALSASLGFGPSISQVKNIYIHDLSNPFLALVYIGLAVSSGHLELVKAYHQLRSDIYKKAGKKIVLEIEKIVSNKYYWILKNKELLLNTDNKTNFLDHIKNITAEDSCLDSSYWAKIFQK